MAIYVIIYIILSIITISVLSYYLNLYINENSICSISKKTCEQTKSVCEQALTTEQNINAIDTMKEFLVEYIPKIKIYQQKMYDIVATIDSNLKANKDLTNDYLLFTDKLHGAPKDFPISNDAHNKISTVYSTLEKMNTEEANNLNKKFNALLTEVFILGNVMYTVLGTCVYNKTCLPGKDPYCYSATCTNPLDYFKNKVNSLLIDISPIIPEIQPYP